MLVFSCLIGCTLLRQCWGQLPHGGWELILLGLLCVIFAFLYTTVLSYRGWGDLLVLVFFGFIPVGGTYYVQAHAITADVWIASLICGLVIDTLLVVNNLPLAANARWLSASASPSGVTCTSDWACRPSCSAYGLYMPAR